MYSCHYSLIRISVERPQSILTYQGQMDQIQYPGGLQHVEVLCPMRFGACSMTTSCTGEWRCWWTSFAKLPPSIPRPSLLSIPTSADAALDFRVLKAALLWEALPVGSGIGVQRFPFSFFPRQPQDSCSSSLGCFLTDQAKEILFSFFWLICFLLIGWDGTDSRPNGLQEETPLS